MKLFVMASSYIINTIRCELTYLLDVMPKKIFLLNENHTTLDMHLNNNEDLCIVELYQDYEKAIIDSDVTLIIQNGNIPVEKVNNANRVAHKNGKESYVIDSHLIYEHLSSNKLFDLCEIAAKKPVVMIYSLGDFCQSYCTEIFLHKCFNELGISFHQEFSLWTKNILSKLAETGMLNKRINLSGNVNEFDVLIVFANGKNVIKYNEEEIELITLMRRLQPDYVIVTCEKHFDDNTEIENIFRYRYACRIDKIIQSHYTFVLSTENEKKPVLCFTIDALDSEKRVGMKNGLMFDIISKIALPKGVSIV